MMTMTQQIGQSGHPTEPLNDLSCAHGQTLRIMRNHVNVECGPLDMQNAYMATTGERLRQLIDRTPGKQPGAAKRAGYAGTSGIQRFVAPEYDEPLPLDVAQRFAHALMGEDVLAIEVIELAEILPPPEHFAEMLDEMLTPEVFSQGRPAAVQALAHMLPEAISRVLAANPPPVRPRVR